MNDTETTSTHTADSASEPQVSVVLIARDERHNLKDYFATIEGLADELIIVDTGSTDGTVEYAEELAKTVSYSTRVLDFRRKKFHDGQTRQHGTDEAKYEYIFHLDADERIGDGFRKNLKPFLKEKKPLLALVPRVDELIPHYIDLMDYRLFKKGGGAYYGDGPGAAVHPTMYFSGEKILFPEPVFHYQGMNHWLRRPHRIFGQLAREVEEVENTRGFLRELGRGLLGFFYKFKKIYYRLNARKDGWYGFKFAFLKGFYVLLGNIFIGLKPRVLPVQPESEFLEKLYHEDLHTD